ncbi:MAG: ATP-binding protein [Victivallaceae bacterium]|nr:ATP-binding protein [Victivallaceae bacterium]
MLFLLALLGAGIFFALIYRRAMRRSMAIYQVLPMRIVVVDRHEKILFHHSPDKTRQEHRKIRYVHDFQQIDYPKISEKITEVFADGIMRSFDYESGSNQRSMTMLKMPPSVFGVDSVVWFSHDNSELQNALHRASELVEENRRTMQKLQNANNLWNTVINAVPFYFFAKDAARDFRYVLNNKPFASLAGVSHIIGKKDEDLFPAEEAELFHAKDVGVMSGYNGEESIEIVTGADGVKHHVHLTKKPFVTVAGRKLLLGVGLDITRLNNLIESEHVTNSAIAQVVLESDFDRNLDRIADTIKMQFSCDRLLFSRFDLESSRFTEIRDFSGPVAKFLHSEDEELLSRFWKHAAHVLEENQLVIISDAAGSHMSDELGMLGIRSTIVAPIFAAGKLFGMVQVAYTRQQRIFSDIDERAMRSTANIISLAWSRKLQTEALQLSDREKNMILDNIKIPLVFFDAEGNLLRVNTEARRVAGLSADADVRKLRCRDLFCNSQEPPPNCPMFRAITTGKETQADLTFFNCRWRVTARPIFNEQGKLLNVVESLVDVTEIEKGKRQQELALKAAQDADRAKSFFIASVSHELRTPLNAVLGFAELLRDDELNREQQKDYLNAISFSGNALLQLINDVLDLSKLESNQMKFVEKECDFAALCRDVAAVFLHSARGKHTKIELDLGHMPLLMVDKLRIRQILFNLLGNAIKFTLNGTITLRTKFHPDHAAGSHMGKLIFAVSDTGSGISQADQKRLFEPFVQLQQLRGTNATNNGTGLGLAIIRRMVERMHGNIHLESEVGKGSTFTVELDHIQWTENTRTQNSTVIDMVIQGAENFSVLAVDDVAMNLKVLGAMLDKFKVRYVLCESAEEALSILTRVHFDLILTDLWMPVMNGETFAREVRKSPVFGATPIVAVTADVEGKENFDRDVFSEFLYKPVTLEKLSGLLHQFYS